MQARPATLLGLAVGDALGVQFETVPFGDERLTTWDGTFGDCPYHKLVAGQWSDDTEMAQRLAARLLADNGYSPLSISRTYVNWLESNNLRGMGKTTRQALTKLRMGLPWTQSGIEGAEGNGTAMRAAPIGVFFQNNIQAVSEFAHIDARITHRSVEACTGSTAVALAVTLLVKGFPKGSLAKVLDWLPESSQVYQRLQPILERAAVTEVSDTGAKHVAQVAERLARMGTAAHVVQTVPAAFQAFLETSCFKDAVESAVRAGGDTDTTAAITGALAGTYYGIEQVEPYLQDLEMSQHLWSLDQDLNRWALPVYLF